MDRKLSAFSTALKRGAKVDADIDYSGSIDAADIADRAVTPVKMSPDNTNNVSPLLVKEIDVDVVKPLLDGNSNTLWEVPANYFVVDVLVVSEAAAGGAATVDIGIDDQWDNGAADADAFIAAHNLNANGAMTRMSRKDEANQTAFAGGLSTPSGQTGSMTIISSGDVSGSSWEGFVAITYYEISA